MIWGKFFKEDATKHKQGCFKMVKTDKPLTRDALVSMQVVDATGKLVGKVADVAFEVGKSGVSLAVVTEEGENKTVPWEDIQAASDFIILKPQQTQTITQTQTEQPQQTASKQKNQTLCPTCQKPLTWIPQYKRWYCYNEKKYV
jgi:sporulation protein YlmC with PRC-barrel domain